MEIIINLWQELLQDIQIKTEQGRKLHMHIDKEQSGCVLVGEFFEITDQAWYLVEFSKQRVADPAQLLKGCLENLQKAMEKKSDSISEIHNTCNAPIVSAERQRELLSELGVHASVRVN
ncbi:hypothetical protein [Crenobacter caeni]|uniref:Uncharacterized protein n=1 Tax=Crenobacter caeni TaxID=2705474 RepID=A0A6B2KT51_9NEIS|nr:hypothetical protein [Crenobacter caeni]NDV13425.1 hypothetical protein [Crenobacter caeni]